MDKQNIQGIANEFLAKLKSISLKELHVKEETINNNSLSSKDSNLNFSLHVSFEEQSLSHANEQEIIAEFKVEAGKLDADYYLVASVIYNAIFIVSPKLSGNDLEEFVNVNAFAIVFPFARETIFNVTARCKAGPIIIPIVNFIRRFHDLKRKP